MRGIAASWLLTGDAAVAPIADGGLIVDAAGTIVAVGAREALARAHPEVAWERHAAVLTPGLVNAHTHLELSALRGRVPGGKGFVPWLVALGQARADAAPEADEEAIGHAVSELVRTGTVAIGEVTNTLAAVPALADMPIAARVFHEVYGVGRDAARQAIAAARLGRRQLAVWPPNISHALSPHAPYSLHPDVLREIVAESAGRDAPTSMHLAEHAAERAFLHDGTGPFAQFLVDRAAAGDGWSAPGLDPVRCAQALGALGPHVIAVHLSDARPDELALVSAARAPVVLCPRSNLHLYLRLPPLTDILAAGIRPGLGTDSLASAPSLDVLEEARALRARFPTVAPRVLVAMATHWGAEALGLGATLGRLAVGLAPGVIAFPHEDVPPDDPEQWLVSRPRSERRVLCAPRTRIAEERPS